MREVKVVLDALARLDRQVSGLIQALERAAGRRPPKRFWKPSEVERVRRDFPRMLTSELARSLERPVYSVFNLANRLGLSKDPAYMASREPWKNNKGNAGSFRKGMVPWNKGRKGWCPKGSEKGWFGKGHRPWQWRPVGSVLKDGDGYSWTKIGEGPRNKAFRLTHVMLWEQHHGPVPQGFNVQFKNKDRTDIRIDNLELVSKRENMQRNTYHNWPAPIKSLVHAQAVLTRAINTKKGEEHENH